MIDDALADFERMLRAMHPDWADGLGAPLAQATLDAVEQRTGVALPDDLRALYQWHDGSPEWKTQDGGPRLFGGFRRLPLERAEGAHTLYTGALWSGYWILADDWMTDGALLVRTSDGQVDVVEGGGGGRWPVFGSVAEFYRMLADGFTEGTIVRVDWIGVVSMTPRFAARMRQRHPTMRYWRWPRWGWQRRGAHHYRVDLPIEFASQEATATRLPDNRWRLVVPVFDIDAMTEPLPQERSDALLEVELELEARLRVPCGLDPA